MVLTLHILLLVNFNLSSGNLARIFKKKQKKTFVAWYFSESNKILFLDLYFLYICIFLTAIKSKKSRWLGFQLNIENTGVWPWREEKFLFLYAIP